MTVDEVLGRLEREGTPETVAGMTRYGIPNDKAFGVPMGTMKKLAKQLGKDHDLAAALWTTVWYEARTVAVFVDVPAEVTGRQMDAWAADFDSWAICDTACFHLFDRTPHAWAKVHQWAASPELFVKRAAYALIWSLSVHDKNADDGTFMDALQLMEDSDPDPRPLVKKAVNMALRATGKRNLALNKAAVETARKLAQSEDKDRSWIGKNALRELESAKVRQRLQK